MPTRRVMASRSASGSRPCTRTLPPSGTRRPAMSSTVLVLPAPFGPRIPKISPWSMERETSSTAREAPYDFLSWSTSTAVGFMAPAFRGRGPAASGNRRCPPSAVRPMGSAPDVGRAARGKHASVVEEVDPRAGRCGAPGPTHPVEPGLIEDALGGDVVGGGAGGEGPQAAVLGAAAGELDPGAGEAGAACARPQPEAHPGRRPA